MRFILELLVIPRLHCADCSDFWPQYAMYNLPKVRDNVINDSLREPCCHSCSAGPWHESNIPAFIPWVLKRTWQYTDLPLLAGLIWVFSSSISCSQHHVACGKWAWWDRAIRQDTFQCVNAMSWSIHYCRCHGCGDTGLHTHTRIYSVRLSVVQCPLDWPAILAINIVMLWCPWPRLMLLLDGHLESQLSLISV